jgi:ligA
MTAQGNLGNDQSDSSDTGVECKIDYDQNILATSQVKIGLRVKPNGYAKYIDVELGFKTA